MHKSPTSAFGLLAGVHLRQNGRRLSGVLRQSKLLSGTILVFLFGYCWLSFAIFHRAMQFIGLSGAGRSACGKNAFHSFRIPLCPSADQ